MSSSPINWRINGFTHVKLLGKGTFAKVNLYLHEQTGEEVAIKTIIKARYDELKIEFPPRELSIMKCLQHPNLAQVYEIIEEEDKIHIVMEYIEGKSLADMIPLTGFSEAYARAIFRDILLAVEYMHGQGIVHRDLKLDNILFTKSDGSEWKKARVKLIDFGLSNSFTGNDLLSTFCGTPQYAAPELLKGEKYVAPPVDIWSLGVLLYAMCVGEFPFETPLETIAAKIPRSAPISSPLRHLLSLIFTPDTSKRITLSKLIRHPWVNIGYPTFPVQPEYSYVLDPEIVNYLQSVNMSASPRSTIRVSNQSLRRYRNENFESFILEFNSFTTLYYLLKQKVERLERNPHLASSPNSQSNDPFSYPSLSLSLLRPKKDKGKPKNRDSCVIC